MRCPNSGEIAGILIAGSTPTSRASRLESRRVAKVDTRTAERNAGAAADARQARAEPISTKCLVHDEKYIFGTLNLAGWVAFQGSINVHGIGDGVNRGAINAASDCHRNACSFSTLQTAHPARLVLVSRHRLTIARLSCHPDALVKTSCGQRPISVCAAWNHCNL
jgi:hypothetical protein